MRDDPQPWWRRPAARAAFVCDLLAGEFARLRPGRAPRPFPWPAELRIETDLGADSLERIHLATALAEAIHLYRSGIDDALLGHATLGEWIEVVARSLDAFSAQITFKTSGSTGHPKWCVHALADLEAEAAWHAERFADVRRVVSVVPRHHIYGFLFAVLLPARLGIENIDARGYAPAQLAAVAVPGDLIVGYPEFWAAFVRSAGPVAPGAAGLTSTAPCPADVARAVVARGIAPLVEIYGSSETAGIGRRDDPDAPFELLPVWRRGDGELLRTVAGAAPRRVSAPDHLNWEGDRHVRPAGRTEGAVQVGGHNVIPARIAAVLAKRPGVAAAAVRLMAPAEGDRLKAFVVPDDPAGDLAALEAQLWAWIDTNLTVPERPKSLVFGSALPVANLGKAADWPL
jgi:4-coumarate--CoA ligase (photoactive yellow protein activation family)